MIPLSYCLAIAANYLNSVHSPTYLALLSLSVFSCLLVDSGHRSDLAIRLVHRTVQDGSIVIVQTKKMIITIEVGIFMDILKVETARKNVVSLELSMVEYSSNKNHISAFANHF